MVSIGCSSVGCLNVVCDGSCWYIYVYADVAGRFVGAWKLCHTTLKVRHHIRLRS
jgi:hypothetical protein